MQKIWVPFLVQENSTWNRANELCPRVIVPQLLKPGQPEPVVLSKRSHYDEDPTGCNLESSLPCATNRESLPAAVNSQCSQKWKTDFFLRIQSFQHSVLQQNWPCLIDLIKPTREERKLKIKKEKEKKNMKFLISNFYTLTKISDSVC